MEVMSILAGGDGNLLHKNRQRKRNKLIPCEHSERAQGRQRRNTPEPLPRQEWGEPDRVLSLVNTAPTPFSMVGHHE